MPSFTVLRRPFAGLAGLTLLLFGHSMEVRSGACQSYEAAFNLEAGMRDGLTLKQAKASILEDGTMDCLLCSHQIIALSFPQVKSMLPLESTHK